MKSSIFLVVVIALLSACVTGSKDGESNDANGSEAEAVYEPASIDEAALREEVEALGTDHVKIAFLRNILTEDQRVRNEEIEANQLHGYNSKAHQQATHNVMDMDAANLKRVDIFTDVYGAPQINSVGRMQSEATWLVVHHAPGTDAHEKYYPILYKAWQNDQISGTNFTMYLNRWYERISGERHMMEGGYTDEEEVKELLELLNLKSVR